MDNNIKIKEELQSQNGASAAVKSESGDPLDLGTGSQCGSIQLDDPTGSKNVAPREVDNKMDVKGDYWSQNGPSVAIKTEPEDMPVSDAGVHETVFVSVGNTSIYSNEETSVKLELKEEPCWHDESCKSEENPDENEMMGSALDAEQILGDVPGEVSRFSSELTCRNSDSATREEISDLESGNSDTNTSDFLSSTEPHIELVEISSITSSDVLTGNLIHDGEKPYKCDICGESFVCVTYLKRHQLIHDKGGFENETCQKNFTLASKLEQNKLINEGQRRHRCDLCEKSFTRSSGLKHHKLIHEGIRPYKCEVCEKTFTNTSTLKVHKLIHEGIRPYKCDVCEKSFTSSSNLKVHKLLHEGKRPHRCEVCEKTFIHAATYKNHKLIHEGKRPHTCNICMKSFKRASHLKKHFMLIHEGKRPYTCKVCEKSFQQSSHLNQHYTVKHEGKRSHVCEICKKSYTRAAYLKRHTLIIHKKALTEISTQS